MTDIDENKGRAVGNSSLDDPRFGNANGTPSLIPSVKPANPRTQTKEVIEHLQQIQKKKKSSSSLSNPAFLGAAMKAIYESSEVSIKRGDQTMVVTQLKGDAPGAIAATEPCTVTAKENPSPIDRSASLPTSPVRVSRPDPFASRPSIEPRQPVSTPELTRPKTNESNGIDVPSILSSGTYSMTDIIFWISLVLVFLGLAFWISR